MIKVTCAAVVGLAVGAATGWTLHAPDPVAAPMAAAARFASPTVTAASGAAVDMGLLRSMMREELSAALANQHSEGQSAALTPSVAPASPELVAQRQEAMREIEAMVNGTQWGNEQRLAFQQRLALLEPDDAQRMLQQVVMGLNQGSIRVTTDGPPL